MSAHSFSLRPFAGESSLAMLPISITGSIARQANQLTIEYALVGDRSQIAIAAPSDHPTRQHNLWQTTCFEFFLGVQHSERYWECNLSPSGDWNLYRFDGYRQGMQEETAIASLPFSVQRSDTLSLTLTLDLHPIIPIHQPLEVAITTVICQQSGELTYWALTHPGPEADFHRRDSFMIQLHP